MSKRVHFVSLGCPKNRVDTEVMLGVVAEQGHQLVATAEEADVVVVNTCAFISEAKQESVDAVLEAVAAKERGDIERVVVAGCLSQRYADDLSKEIPEVDNFLGSSDMLAIAGAVTGGGPRLSVAVEPRFVYGQETPRLGSAKAHSVYVKIAEGCDRPCAFCIIPQLRGAQRSRSVEDIAAEVTRLVEGGAVEVNLVAQDLTNYGKDLPAGDGAQPVNLAALVRRLGGEELGAAGLKWLRLHYLYPSAVTDELLDAMAESKTVLPYFDMPVQHVNDDLLRKMRRGHTGKTIRNAIANIRSRFPSAILRTTIIAGHPGETEAGFAELRDFVAETKFDRLGVFAYSREEGTISALLPLRVPAREGERRRRELMRLQRTISKEKQKALLGQKLDVLVDGASGESEYLLEGRWWGQAPEVDGTLYLTDGTAKAGDIVSVTVTNAADYDLAGSMATA